MAALGERSCLLLTCLLVFLFAGQSMARPARQLQTIFEDGNKVVRAELFHRDHPESPLSGNTTTAERLLAAVNRSEQRRSLLVRPAEATDFQSPVKIGPIIGPDAGSSIEYVMSLSIGTPAKKFIAMVDTGSDLVWLQCNCVKCLNQKDPYFNISASTSFRAVSCGNPFCVPENFPVSNGVSCGFNNSCIYNYAYGDASNITGLFATETIYLKDSTGKSTTIEGFAFGCSVETNGFFNGADGLVGFGRGPQSLPSQMGTLYSEVFSYCLVPFAFHTKSSSKLLFGSTASTNDSTLTKIPLLSNPFNPTFYYVPLIGISVNGESLDIPASTFAINSSTGDGGVILDSGTTTTLLPPASLEPLAEVFSKLITYPEVNSTEFELCYDISQVKQPVYPNVTLQFSGIVPGTVVDFVLAADNLFVPIDDKGHVQCAPLFPSSGVSIIGNVMQSNHLLEYDLVNQHVGWVQQDCNK